MKRFPRLKFCGLTRAQDVEHAIEAGASAIGLNFVSSSKRFIAPRAASALSRVGQGRILRVGVFVNASPAEIVQVIHQCPLDAIQLHGDEGIEWLEQSRDYPPLYGIPIFRALPYRGAQDDRDLEQWSQEANDPVSPVNAILIDAFDPIHRGGTGKVARWDLLFPRPGPFFSSRTVPDCVTPGTRAPMILAGGIDRNNVLEACAIARPDGIDIASGIESAPGIKDRAAMFAIAHLLRDYFLKLDEGSPP
jgi:phosphoribosylanthranilate isomerase